MDFENNDSMESNQPEYHPEPTPQPEPQPRPQPQQTPPPPPVQPTIQPVIIEREVPKKGGGFMRVLMRIVFVLSILTNLVLFVAVIGMGVMMGTGEEFFVEKTIVASDSADKIAVISMRGVINDRMSYEILSQIKQAQSDGNVRAVILRVVSPGGGVSASDQIHHALTQLRKKTNKPVVAFFQTVAASGGYYAAVACDEIVAEPTAITGSIGVIMSHMVVKDLVEKIGISPVVIKSGPKKDWPSMFSDTTDEQKDYLNSKLIQPSYDRFVSLVAKGRQDMLTEEQVRKLADGSIYGAEEALENKLIDKIGYFDVAVDRAKTLAGLNDAHVIEYFRPASFMEALMTESKLGITIDQDSIQEMMVPKLMYLWDGRN